MEEVRCNGQVFLYLSLSHSLLSFNIIPEKPTAGGREGIRWLYESLLL